ncbi:aromatic ring-opening dioxygenase LigA [Streptomyces sp. NPDC101116]|uniref:aromatic ring-opening dioxygenase LigA n=1 Tax=Streptomyces sp. NPDC101116 TaxID=3366107 RepID=UPI00382847E0
MTPAKPRARLEHARRMLDAPPPELVPGQAALDVGTAPPTEEKPRPKSCDTGKPRCGAPARFYPAGWRCDRHRPSTYRPE